MNFVTNNNPNQSDPKVDPNNTPKDSISCIRWLNNTVFALSSWDGDLRIYELIHQNQQFMTPNMGQIQIEQRKLYQFQDQTPILSISFKDDGSQIYMGLGDGRLMVYDLNNGQTQQLAQHQQAISSVHYVPQMQIVVTGDFDNKLTFYQGNNPTVFQLDQKVHDMDIKYPILIAGLSNNKILILDLTKIQQFQQTKYINNQHYIDCMLSSNISCICISQDMNGYGVGTYDGRANLCKFQRDHMGNLKNGDSIICFKCHKIDNPGQNNQVLMPVNAIACNIRGKPNCITVGSDGVINVWDYVVKNKAVTFSLNYPVTRLAVSPDGSKFVYALGYDWHQGFNGFDPQNMRPQIYIHVLKDEELQSKKN